MKDQQGFSMAELLVVIAVIGVLAAVATPNLLVWRQNAHINSAARGLLASLQKARSEAIKRNGYCAVSFVNQQVGGETYDYLVFMDADRDLAYDAGELVIKGVKWAQFAGDVSFDASQGGGDGLTFANPANGIAFAANGLPRCSILGQPAAGTVFLKNNGDRRRQVLVSSAGSIRIQ